MRSGFGTVSPRNDINPVGTAFRNNTEIEVLDLRAFVSSNLVQQSFQGMTNLKELYVQPNVTTNTGGDANLTNNTMTKMEKVVLSWKFERIKRYSWAHAQTATLIIGDAEHGSNLLSIASYYGIRDSFKNIVLYATTPPYWHTSDSSFAKSTGSAGSSCLPNNCKVYVPDSAVDAYKNSGATMWGNFASRIYPISEFEGEL